MTGDAPHVPVPKPGAALSRLLGTLDTLAAGDRMEEWLGAYATDHDWLPNPINPLSIHVAFPDTWRGAPSRVKGVQLWPGAAIRRDVGERGLHLAHAAQWTMTMAGSGNAMHPTWVGGSLMVAGLGDPGSPNWPPSA